MTCWIVSSRCSVVEPLYAVEHAKDASGIFGREDTRSSGRIRESALIRRISSAA